MRDLADLAAQGIVTTRVPIDGRMEPQKAQREDERYCQKPFCGAFRHVEFD